MVNFSAPASLSAEIETKKNTQKATSQKIPETKKKQQVKKYQKPKKIQAKKYQKPKKNNKSKNSTLPLAGPCTWSRLHLSYHVHMCLWYLTVLAQYEFLFGAKLLQLPSKGAQQRLCRHHWRSHWRNRRHWRYRRRAIRAIRAQYWRDTSAILARCDTGAAGGESIRVARVVPDSTAPCQSRRSSFA